MDVQDFRKDFLEEVKISAAVEGCGSTVAFLKTATEYLANAEVIGDFYFAFCKDTGKRNRNFRVDGYVQDDFDNSVNLFVADYTGDLERETVTKSAIKTNLDKALSFLDEVYTNNLKKRFDPSDPVSGLIEELLNNKENIRKFKLTLITDGLMSSRVSNLDGTEIFGIPVEYQVWDIERIYKICCSEIGRQQIEIDFKSCNNGKGIPCIEASDTNGTNFKSYLCVIPGALLADIYDRYGSQLLEGNVRSFLSTKVAVNKKIRETILNAPQNFFAYNNGVSATASGLEFENAIDGKVVTFVKDFQIINGGQTTASLFNARFKDKADLSQIYVQMKLTQIECEEEMATEMVRNISRSSNSQNKVSDADFFATHPFHVRMEQISRGAYAHATGGIQNDTKWFYERARGQFLQAQMKLTKAGREKFLKQNPKNQVITKTDFAKYVNTWDGLPHFVSKGAQTNFMKFADIVDANWETKDSIYNEKFFKDTVAIAILFKFTETLVSHQPWYEQGYRANIVTYSLALLNVLAKKQFKGYDVDLQQIWNRQEVPELIRAELVKITKFVFDRITSTERKIMNVTQWCKRVDCWEDIQKCSIVLSNEFAKIMISKSERRAKDRAAKNDQTFISDVEAQSIVINFGAQGWSALAKFVAEKRFNINSKQVSALKYAVNIPNTIPSGFQSRQLLALLEEAKSNGFKIE